MRIDKNRDGLNVGAKQQRHGGNIKLHLHIGTEKTGTTSFQKWLLQHQEQLEACGIIRPAWPDSFLPDINHRMLAVYAQGFTPGEDGQVDLGLKSAAQYKALCKAFARTFAQEVAQRCAGDWIISSEHLHSRLVDVAQVQQLAAFLQPHFSEIIIHIHLRPQVDLARSVASTFSRRGGRVTAEHFNKVTPKNPYYNYHKLVGRWAQVFGMKQVRLVAYKRQPSIRRYFLKLWGLEGADFGAELIENQAESWQVMALKNAIHPYRGQIPDALKLNGMLNRAPEGAVLQPGLEVAKAVTARMGPSNAALIKVRPDLAMADLTPDLAAYDHAENLSRLEVPCDFAPQAATLIAELQGALFLERARSHVLRAQAALQAGRKGKARAWLAEAATQMAVIEPTWKERWPFIRLSRHISKMVLDSPQKDD